MEGETEELDAGGEGKCLGLGSPCIDGFLCGLVLDEAGMRAGRRKRAELGSKKVEEDKACKWYPFEHTLRHAHHKMLARRLFTTAAHCRIPRKGDRVVVAMSGGVDSSVAARLLADKVRISVFWIRLRERLC